MGETVDELLRRAEVAVRRDDELACGAERDESFARRDRAEADRPDGRVAAAGGDDRALRQPSSRAADGRIVPTAAEPSTSGGAQLGSASQAAIASADQARAASSSIQLPAASLMSVARSPQSARRR